MATLDYLAGHPAGLCDVAYLETNGEVHVISCGQDGKLCYRAANDHSTVVKMVDTHTEGQPVSALTCVAASPSGDRVTISDEDNMVKVFTFPGGELHNVATRFALPARCLAYSPSGLHLAASGDDEGIKLIDLASNKVFRTLRSEAYTRGLAYDPESDFLAAASADGTLTVWGLVSGKAECIKKKACSKVDPKAPVRVTPAWHPDGGSLLAVPSADGSITFYERLSWETAGELSGEHASEAHILAFSKNGLYLASAAADQSVVIWDVVERTSLAKTALPGAVCGLKWHPTGNELAVATEDGQVALWKNPVPANLPGPCADPDALAGVKKSNPMIDDAAADDGSQGGAGDDSEDDYDHGDSFLADSPGARPRGHRRSRAHNGSGRYAIAAAFNPLTDLPQPQAAIQPGSTDMDSGRRYLSYTSLGAITLRSESDHNVVEVAFHDTARARRRVPLLSDFFGFRLGALGERGAFYASHSSIDAPSTLVYRPFESWAPNADWSMGLPAGEEAECIATGDSFCAVATSTRNLRLFSLGGLQTGILALAGAPVALAACGHTLAVAWHSAPPTPSGDQSICFTVYDTAEQRLVSQGSLALSPGATLAWLGFSEDGMLSTYDSEGVLRLRTPSFGGAWMPAFSAAAERKGSEHFWVFAVSVAAKEVQCIVCANSPEPTVPSGLARPVVTAAPLRINVVPHDETLAPLEADVLRQALLIAHLGAREADPDAADMATLQAAQVESDRASLRLFTRLAQTDRLVRALEVASGMQTAVGLEGARKIANHQRLSALAKQVAALIEQRAAMEAEAAEAEYMNQLNTRDVYGGAVAVREPAPAVHMGPRVAAVAGEPAGSPAAHGSGDDGEAEDDSKVENGPPNRTPVAEKDGENGAAPKRKAPVGNPFARKKSTKA